MTVVEKYHNLLQGLGELLAQKNDKIETLKWQISVLENRVKEAEAAAKELQEGAQK